MSIEDKVDEGSRENFGHKAKAWVKRYLPAEILSTIAAYTGSRLTYELTKNEAYAAFAATQAGNVAYYGYMLGKDCYSAQKDKQLSWKQVPQKVKNLLVEFGPSGLLDALFIRPLCTEIATEQIGREVGVIAGRLAADVSFYTLTIFMYEQIRKCGRG